MVYIAMDELSLYEKNIELSNPWFVEGIAFDDQSKSVTVHVAIDSNDALRCPKCKVKCLGYDTRPGSVRFLSHFLRR